MPTAWVTIRVEPYYRRAALESGLHRVGYDIVDHRSGIGFGPVPRPESRDDLLVVWNLKAGPVEDHCSLFEHRGGTVIVMENGYLQREDKTVYALGVHGHNGAGWFPHDDSIDRFTPLGFSQWPWRGGGEHILVCGQRGVGSKAMASPIAWSSRESVSLSFRFRGREIRHRPHPGNFAPNVPLDDDLKGAYGCVIWSSASGVRALVRGIPVFYDAPHWICSDVALRLPALKPGFDKPSFSHEDVHRALRRMAWGQWGVAELDTGEPFARMKAEDWGRVSQ